MIAGQQNDRPKISLSRFLVLCLVFDLGHHNRYLTQSRELILPLPRFSVRTLMLAVAVVGVAIPIAITGFEYHRFARSKTASFERMLSGGENRDRATLDAFTKLTFANRYRSIIGFAGIHHQSNDAYCLFVDWYSLDSGADSLMVTLYDGRTISCPLSETYGTLESTHFDSDVYYHHSILVGELGLVDGTEIKHVRIGQCGTAISDPAHPEKWKPQH